MQQRDDSLAFQIQKQGLFLYWQEETPNILRIFRIIRWHQQWLKTLYRIRRNWQPSPDWFTGVVQIQQLNQQKQRHYHLVSQQPINSLLTMALLELIERRSVLKDSAVAYQYFINMKERLRNHIERKSHELTKDYSPDQHICGYVLVALQQRPGFQLSTSFFDAGVPPLFNHPRDISSLTPREKQIYQLEEIAIQRARGGLGTLSLGIELLLGTIYGYHVNTLLTISQTISQDYDRFMVLLEQLNLLDELSYFNHQAKFQWLSGLMLQIIPPLLLGMPIMPLMLAYIATTGVVKLSNEAIEVITNHFHCTTQTKQRVHLTNQLLSFRYIYPRVYQATEQRLLPPATNTSSDAQAMGQFGFYKSQTEVSNEPQHSVSPTPKQLLR